MRVCLGLWQDAAYVMATKLDFKRGFALFGIVVALLMITLGCYGLFQDLESLWTTGSPHMKATSSLRSAWLTDLDNLFGGWLTIPMFGLFVGYASYVLWIWWHIYLAPNGVVLLERDKLKFSRSLYRGLSVSYEDIVSVDLTFDPDLPSSRSDHWLWGDWNDRLSISFKKSNGKIKKITISAGRVCGECDSLADFGKSLKTQFSLANTMRS
jgi:hypothetical protein